MLARGYRKFICPEKGSHDDGFDVEAYEPFEVVDTSAAPPAPCASPLPLERPDAGPPGDAEDLELLAKLARLVDEHDPGGVAALLSPAPLNPGTAPLGCIWGPWVNGKVLPALRAAALAATKNACAASCVRASARTSAWKLKGGMPACWRSCN
jgi:hypothetical protein